MRHGRLLIMRKRLLLIQMLKSHSRSLLSWEPLAILSSSKWMQLTISAWPEKVWMLASLADREKGTCCADGQHYNRLLMTSIAHGHQATKPTTSCKKIITIINIISCASKITRTGCPMTNTKVGCTSTNTIRLHIDLVADFLIVLTVLHDSSFFASFSISFWSLHRLYNLVLLYLCRQ